MVVAACDNISRGFLEKTSSMVGGFNELGRFYLKCFCFLVFPSGLACILRSFNVCHASHFVLRSRRSFERSDTCDIFFRARWCNSVAHTMSVKTGENSVHLTVLQWEAVCGHLEAIQANFGVKFCVQPVRCYVKPDRDGGEREPLILMSVLGENPSSVRQAKVSSPVFHNMSHDSHPPQSCVSSSFLL